MASSGLSRRRIGGGGGGSSMQSDSPSESRSNDGDIGEPSRTPTTANGHAGSAFSSLFPSNKIAYDPRDLPQSSSEGGSLPHLTLMEEVLLLGLKDRAGYLSFWNDNISYALRGCILIELALRRKIAVVKDPSRRRVHLIERLVEVVDDKMTGETILDETLRMMKGQQDPPVQTPGSASGSSSFTSGGGEKLSINTWIDLLSGETWNVLKIGFQLKQVRERLAKGLVDKGVLRTEKRNFLLFDMATHPVADGKVKASLITRLLSILTATTSSVPPAALLPEGTQCRVIRSVCLVCAAYTASVLDNAFGGTIGLGSYSTPALGYEEREAAFSRADEILAEFSSWPWGSGSDGGSTPASRKRSAAPRIATGSSSDPGRESVLGLVLEAKKEMASSQSSGASSEDGEDLGFELVAGVLEVLSKLDSLL